MNATDEAPAANDLPSPAPARDWKRRARLPLMLLAPVVVIVAALYFYLSGGRYESTDDAYVQAARVAISANVAGRVLELAVKDNQPVRKGDLLFRIDDAPFLIAVDEAQAQLAAARLQIESLKANYRQRQSELSSAQDTLAFQQREYERQQRLLGSGIASQLQVDRAKHALDEARAQVAGAQQQIGAVVANLGGDPNIAPDQHPMVQEAQARLDRAKLNLSYTTVTAPSDGVATRVEQLQVGSYINASAPVFALVSTGDIWIEANFKEDQLTHMRAGQKVDRRRRQLPRADFRGHGREREPRHRLAVLGAAAGERHRQLGQGRAAASGARRSRRTRPGLPAACGTQRDREGRHAAISAHLFGPSRWRRSGQRKRAMNAAVATEGHAAGAPHRTLITLSVMLATIMQALDTTIANVALPRIQGSLSATQDQMAWVLTSYIVAAAIMTPLSGWLAGQVGRKRVFLFSVAGFTFASALCGLAQIAARDRDLPPAAGHLRRGAGPDVAGGAARHQPARKARQGHGDLGDGRSPSGPILGPALGGWLTENYSWRWVFYINVPFGILSFLGILSFMPETQLRKSRFDFFGFAMLSLAIGASS